MSAELTQSSAGCRGYCWRPGLYPPHTMQAHLHWVLREAHKKRLQLPQDELFLLK
uniref:Uncharacterized protein n=1 Tax=Anguilla anguilla TaxID=7936 RepID=A0A0E9QGE8_ANGAN